MLHAQPQRAALELGLPCKTLLLPGLRPDIPVASPTEWLLRPPYTPLGCAATPSRARTSSYTAPRHSKVGACASPEPAHVPSPGPEQRQPEERRSLPVFSCPLSRPVAEGAGPGPTCAAMAARGAGPVVLLGLRDVAMPASGTGSAQAPAWATNKLGGAPVSGGAGERAAPGPLARRPAHGRRRACLAGPAPGARRGPGLGPALRRLRRGVAARAAGELSAGGLRAAPRAARLRLRRPRLLRPRRRLEGPALPVRVRAPRPPGPAGGCPLRGAGGARAARAAGLGLGVSSCQGPSC